MEKNDRQMLILSVLIPLAVGALSALLSGNMASYESLNRPALSPPAYVFPIVWTILYAAMGVSAWLIARTDSGEKGRALRFYTFQLFLNFGWSIIFFRFSLYLTAFFLLLALLAVLAGMIGIFSQIDARAAWLQLPYFVWCCFAAYLNFMIYRLN